MMNEYFNCDNVGGLKEYVGCKIERKIDQKIGELSSPVSSGDESNEKEQKRYRTGVGKLLYLSRWS
jgi:hypothetical protein